eukprot:gene58340-biopygen22565
MRYTQKKGYNVVGWELGDEPTLHNNRPTLPAATNRLHFAMLFNTITRAYGAAGGGNRSSPYAIGPDSGSGAVTNGYLASFLSGLATPGVDVVSYHHYHQCGGPPATVEEFLRPDVLNEYASVAKAAKSDFSAYAAGHPSAQLWLGEAGGAGSATKHYEQIVGHFVGVF